MRSHSCGLAVTLLLGLFFTAPHLGRAQCEAPDEWFPHATTPEPDFHQPGSNCEFHQWAWQEFLWLTQPDGGGRLRLLGLPTADMLFAAGRAPAPLESQMVQRQLKSQTLRLTPRVVKAESPTAITGIEQAVSRGVLVDRNGKPVYYASFVSPEYYEFVRTKKLYLKPNYLAADGDLNFPVKAMTLKSAWRVVADGESTDGLFTTKAMVPTLKCADGADTCSGRDVAVDMTNQVEVTVALVGLHIVGVLEGHPEFVWSTFEHVENAPDLPAGADPHGMAAVSPNDFTFYRANKPAMECNVISHSLDVGTQKLSPVTDVFRHFAFGGGNAQDTGNIKDLNESVHSKLAADSVWKSYMLVGGVWFGPGAQLVPGLTSSTIQPLVVGSVQLSNSTMETFTQEPGPSAAGPRSNCFSCHTTKNVPTLGAKNLNLSHILRQNLIDREELPQFAAMNLSLSDVESLQRAGINAAPAALQASPLWAPPAQAAPLASYADVKSLLDAFVVDNNIPIIFSPHRAFWRTMTYQDFVNGNIPNVADPDTGDPLKVLIVGNSAQSNLIMSLRGAPGTIFDPETGLIGRMPPSGPFMTDADIQRLAAWIDAGAPE